MTGTIQAIPTAYNGIVFRSRLEARWAMLFSLLNVRYEYEKEGYIIRNPLVYEHEKWYMAGEYKYVPDFYLPDVDIWVEVKPFAPSVEESEKAAGLALLTKKNVLMVFDLPNMYFAWRKDVPPYIPLEYVIRNDTDYKLYTQYDKEPWDNCRITICNTCKQLIVFDGIYDEIQVSCPCNKEEQYITPPTNEVCMLLHQCIEKAIKHRFW